MFPFSFFISDDSVGSCEANFHSKAVVYMYVYTKSIRCNEKKLATAEREFSLTSLMLIFSSFPLIKRFHLLVEVRSLEAACEGRA